MKLIELIKRLNQMVAESDGLLALCVAIIQLVGEYRKETESHPIEYEPKSSVDLQGK